MSIRNLDSIFRPKSVALIGASTRSHSVGRVIAENLLAAGFSGPMMPVNPKYETVTWMWAYPDVASLPLTPDLAVICTPPASVPGLVAVPGVHGVKGVVVTTAGFGELGSAEGRTLEQAMLDAARPHLLRIVGPNCLGVISTPARLNATFAHLQPTMGSVAFVTQSGAMATTVLDWATARGIGFSHLVSLGDMIDVDFGDMLDYLALDPNTSAVLLYIEAVTSARKFMSAARAAARLKPVIALKAGRHAGGARTAASHTGAMAGIDGVYDAAFRRVGIVRVYDLEEVFDAVQTLASPPRLSGDGLVILTNDGGIGVLAADALLGRGGRLAELSDATRAKLDAVLVLNCPTAVASGVEAAEAVIAVSHGKQSAVLASWLSAETARKARPLFQMAGIPDYDTPDKAIRGYWHLVRYRQSQDILMEIPPSIGTDIMPDDDRARGVVGGALARGRVWLDEIERCELFACYRIPTVLSALARSAAEAATQAADIGGRVALKIFSSDIAHKSDVGGVVLDLDGPEEVQAAAEAMAERVQRARPDARLEGFIVQEMIRRRGAHELILGMAVDVTFGPFLLFGHGGTAVEVIDDKALVLPPLNLNLARETMSRTRVYRELFGYRAEPPAAIDAIAETLVRLSQLVCDIDEVTEIDINPLLADSEGVVVLDTRVRIAAPPASEARARGGRLAIRPYPKQLERRETLPGVGDVLLRPVQPEDEPTFVRFLEQLTPEDMRLRFFSARKILPHRQLARLTQIDYDREMAFVLEAWDRSRPADILGIVRFVAVPDNLSAEFAVTVRSDLKGHGIGTYLMHRLIEHVRRRSIGELFGDILHENVRMIALTRDLSFSIEEVPNVPDIVRARLAL